MADPRTEWRLSRKYEARSEFLAEHAESCSACPEFSIAKGPGLRHAIVGEPAPFVVCGRDAVARPVSFHALRSEMCITISGPARAPLRITQQPGKPDQLRAIYVAPVSGRYTIEVTLRGAHLPGSPFELVVEAANVAYTSDATPAHAPSTTPSAKSPSPRPSTAQRARALASSARSAASPHARSRACSSWIPSERATVQSARAGRHEHRSPEGDARLQAPPDMLASSFALCLEGEVLVGHAGFPERIPLSAASGRAAAWLLAHPHALRCAVVLVGGAALTSPRRLLATPSALEQRSAGLPLTFSSGPSEPGADVRRPSARAWAGADDVCSEPGQPPGLHLTHERLESTVRGWVEARPSGDEEDDSGQPAVAMMMRFCRAGTYEVHFAIGSRRLVGSPLRLRVEPSNVSPAACVIEGDGRAVSVAGELVQLRVWLFDGLGNFVPAREDVVASLSARLELLRATPGGTACAVHGEGDVQASTADAGGLCLSYVAQTAGLHALHVLLGGIYLAKAPLPVQVGPSCVHAPSCEATGSGTRLATAGENSGFLVRLRDRFGNACPADSSRLVVELLPQVQTTPRLCVCAALVPCVLLRGCVRRV